MKKILAVLFATILLIGCQKLVSSSSTSAMFVIIEISQNTTEKENKVCQYKIREYVSSGSTTNKYSTNSRWHTLSEGFNVGDTLYLNK